MTTHHRKAAIVTGASQGIGAGLVEAFLKLGYNVVANSRNITKANPFPASANLALVDGDIGDPNTATKIVDTAVSRFGRVDVLINNAGMFIPEPFTEYTTEDFNALVSTTLAGFLYVSQLAVKQMLRQKSGSIVNVSTTLVGHAVVGVPAALPISVKGGVGAGRRRAGAAGRFGMYAEGVQTGNLLFLTGMLPTEGRAAKFIGRVGAELDVETGRKAAYLAALNGLAVAREYLGSLDKVTRIIRLGVLVATSGDVRDQPKVADGASELLQDIFGKGKNPSRLVYGVASLPLGTPVELELIFEVSV